MFPCIGIPLLRTLSRLLFRNAEGRWVVTDFCIIFFFMTAPNKSGCFFYPPLACGPAVPLHMPALVGQTQTSNRVRDLSLFKPSYHTASKGFSFSLNRRVIIPIAAPWRGRALISNTAVAAARAVCVVYGSAKINRAVFCWGARPLHLPRWRALLQLPFFFCLGALARPFLLSSGRRRARYYKPQLCFWG